MILLYIAIAIGLFFLFGGSVFAVFTTVRDNIPDWWSKEFSTREKAGLLALVMLMFGGLSLFLIGCSYNEAIFVIVGLIFFLAGSIGSAVIGSPLEVLTAGSSAGCIGSILVVPSTIISTLACVAFGWIFALVSVFRGSSQKFRGIAILCLVALTAVCCYAPTFAKYIVAQQQINQHNKSQQQAQSIAGQLENKARQCLNASSTEMVDITTEEHQYLNQNGYESIFDLEACGKLLADAFSDAYRSSDINRIIQLMEIANLNKAELGFNDHGVDMFFSSEFVAFVANHAKNNGTYKDFYDFNFDYDVYRYKCYNVQLETKGFVAQFIVDRDWYEQNASSFGPILNYEIATPEYREIRIEEYYCERNTYYLVGETVSLITERPN